MLKRSLSTARGLLRGLRTSSRGKSGRTAMRPALETLEGRVVMTNLPPGFSQRAIASGFGSPTAMEFAPDGRLFVLTQNGDVKLIRTDGSSWTALHLNVNSDGERGLLGIAFDPNFATNRFVYLYYTNPNPGAAPWAQGLHNQLSRFRVNDANPQRPVFTNEAPILDLNRLTDATNHNGGGLHFGTGGLLYVSVGDNVQTFTRNGQPFRVSQTLGSLLGKELRLDVAAFNSGNAVRNDTRVGRLIPASNPFVGRTTGINQLIFALGLRNPFSLDVQPRTGKIFVNDVGEFAWEEINHLQAGANYGWSGDQTDGFGQRPPGPGTSRDPVLAYNHSGGPAGGGRAIVGGAFYNPATRRFPTSYVGKYFYTDLVNGWIRVFDPARPGTRLNPDTSTEFATNNGGNVRDLKIGSAGNLNFLSGNNNGTVYRITYNAPSIRMTSLAPATAGRSTATAGQSITLSATAAGSSLNYRWQRMVGGVWRNLAGSSSTLTLRDVPGSTAGRYRVIVRNALGSATSTPITVARSPK